MFDGVPWSSPALVSSYLYSPRAPFSADVLAYALISEFFAARYNGRLLFCQSYGFDGLDGVSEGGASRRIFQTNYVRIAEVDSFLDAAWTHIRAAVVFAAIPPGDSEAVHRVIVTDGTVTNNGSPTRTAIAGGNLHTFSWQAWNLAAWERSVYVAGCEVSLSGLTLDQDLEIFVEGYAALGSAAATYRPICVVGWAEVIDA